MNASLLLQSIWMFLHLTCSVKKRVLLEISQNSKETAATLVQVFSCEFCEISKSNFSTEHLRTTASVHMEHRITLITFDYGT